MERIKYFLAIAIITISFSISFSQSNKEINFAIKTGNSTELANYFITNLELIIGDKEGVYSKSQALAILKEFYKNNTPTDFSILHEGGKDGAKYVIGNLKTNKSTFRVYYLIKNQENKPYIHTLRIEKE
jgi:hypothetical protein